MGKQVLFLETSENSCRIGEGAFIRLKDGGIMFAFTEFLQGTGHDHDDARITARISYDEGESWGENRVLFFKSEQAVNVMNVSLLRLQNGALAIFYTEKYMGDGDRILDRILMRISRDEGITWGDPVRCFPVEGYHVLNNDRVIRLKSGRILVPVALHALAGTETKVKTPMPGAIMFSVSDDDGKSWRVINRIIHSPFHDRIQFQEPGVYQHGDGRIWMWCRTGYGCQYMAYSDNDAETWSDVEPGLFFSSPLSPMQVKKTGDYTVAIFNPIPEFSGRDCAHKGGKEPWGRTPLVCAVSRDDGKNHDGTSFKEMVYLEDDRTNGYCYPSIFSGKDYFLTAYYHTNDTGFCLNSTKVLKVMHSELEMQDAACDGGENHEVKS